MNSSINRRSFVKMSAAAALALTTRSTSLFAEKVVKPLRILILGGTGFTGPFQVKYALSRGHKVTVFNRGKTHPGELPNEVEQLIGDRNGKLDALKDRQWDVVIDNPTSLPAWVRDAAQILKGNVERYVFISTISVYVDVKTGPDENARLQNVRSAEGAFRKGSREMVSRKNADYSPRAYRRPSRRERPLYVLAC